MNGRNVDLLAGIDAASERRTYKVLDTRTEAADKGFKNERFLREEPNVVNTIATGDEERAGITDLAKKISRETKSWLKDKKLATKLHFMSMPMKLDKPVQRLVAKGIDPDRVYRVLKLHKSSNTNVDQLYVSGEFMLWKKLTAE
ncbi:hypothetical protein P3T76_009558 [Phytophthora citrophthora]|uniref:RxLR effector protein n=1 Tax=Phytophthora citrophthora TaxID=4793 RepID=A0AAD9LIT2_9STRA|nr:hypothetical protein P3T76_009558 [Phytophthora citrophthora]